MLLSGSARMLLIGLAILLLGGAVVCVSFFLFKELSLIGVAGFGLVLFGIRNVVTRQAQWSLRSGWRVTGTQAVIVGVVRILNGLFILAVVWYVVYVLSARDLGS